VGKTFVASSVCTAPLCAHSSLSIPSSPTPSIKRDAKLVTKAPPIATMPEILATDVVSEIDVVRIESR
jgi:hypothetical protein